MCRAEACLQSPAYIHLHPSLSLANLSAHGVCTYYALLSFHRGCGLCIPHTADDEPGTVGRLSEWKHECFHDAWGKSPPLSEGRDGWVLRTA
jgi:hypothetical protein